jgi:hypothetical protein
MASSASKCKHKEVLPCGNIDVCIIWWILGEFINICFYFWSARFWILTSSLTLPACLSKTVFEMKVWSLPFFITSTFQSPQNFSHVLIPGDLPRWGVKLFFCLVGSGSSLEITAHVFVQWVYRSVDRNVINIGAVLQEWHPDFMGWVYKF